MIEKPFMIMNPEDCDKLFNKDIRPKIKAEIEKLLNANITNSLLYDINAYKCGHSLSDNLRKIAKLPRKFSDLRYSEQLKLLSTLSILLERLYEEIEFREELIANYYY